MKSEKNTAYWTFNLPLQLWPENGEDEEGPVTGYRILNYMPRRERCETLRLEDCLGDQTKEEYLEQAALVFENLAKLFRQAKKNPEYHIYYPDETPEEECEN